MKIERFQSGMSRVYVSLMILSLIGFFWNLYDRTHIDSFIMFGCGLFIVLLMYFEHKYTYLDIADSKRILNRQQLRKDNFKISDIVHVERIYFRRSRTAVTYYKGLNGILEYSFLFETLYPKDTLRNIIERLVTINPNINLSDSYNQLLQTGELEKNNLAPMDSHRSVRKRLEAEGFNVRRVPWWDF